MDRHNLNLLKEIDFGLPTSSLDFPDIYDQYRNWVSKIAYTAFRNFIILKSRLTSEILQQSLKNIKHPEQHLTEKNKEIAEEKRELTLLSQQIIHIMEEEQLYKEMRLTVNDVACKVGSQTYLVSKAINSILGKNFFELVNRYRVDEAKKLLKDESMDYLSIIGIGFEAGFNSKTSFNTSFKNYTGMTPREFKRI